MIGSGFIKIRDFSLVYGILFLLFKIFESERIDNSETSFFYGLDPSILLAAGFCSTILLLFDPGSYFIKDRFPYEILTKKVKKQYGLDELNFKQYLEASLNINSIIFEKNKLIYLFYFLISIVFVLFYVWKIIFFSFDGILFWILFLVITFLFGLLVYGIYKKYRNKWQVFQDYLFYTAWYKISVQSDHIFESTSENLRKSIELGDWAIAKHWCDQVKLEYEHQEKQRESRQKEFNLHVNNLLNKFIKHCGYNGLKANAQGGWCNTLMDNIDSFGLNRHLFSHLATFDKTKNIRKLYEEILANPKNQNESNYFQRLTLLGNEFKYIFDSVDLYPTPISGACEYCLVPTMSSNSEIDFYSKKFQSLHLGTLFPNT